LQPGDVFAGYEIVRQLGVGGMGEVYLGRHPRLPRHDALKLLPADVTSDAEYRQRFNREADIVAMLWHPHIVAVHDRGEDDGRLWISMDYVEGTDAGTLLEQRYPHGMPAAEAARIVRAVAEALDYAHERKLLHRDIKPGNILLGEPDSNRQRILLADFGIARWADDKSALTATNVAVGTVAYAAPEQLLGGPVDGRADQYALAATAYQLLTGNPPFHDANQAVVISKHISETPPDIGTQRPELSALGPVIAKAMSKSPDDRYGNCVDFARALDRRLGVAADADPWDATQPALPSAKRRRLPRGVAIAAAVMEPRTQGDDQPCSGPSMIASSTKNTAADQRAQVGSVARSPSCVRANRH